MMSITFALFLLAVKPFQANPAPKQLIDNNRVSVWEGAAAKGDPGYDRVGIDLTRPGDVVFVPKGATPSLSTHAILVQLKNISVPPLPNTTKYPNAFPRPRVKKVLENSRVLVWDYTWTAGQPAPMHFHDKDVVVVYLADGELKSTTPDGQSVVNPISMGLTRYNTRDRTHTEEVVKGSARAIIVELK